MPTELPPPIRRSPHAAVALAAVVLSLLRAAPAAAAEPRAVVQVDVALMFIQLDAQIAADWGLDGGPAAKPESTPLKKEIPAVLTPAEAQAVFTALRQQPGTRILGSVRKLMHAGEQGYAASIQERQFLADLDQDHAPPADGGATNDADDRGQDQHGTGGPKRVLRYGDPRADLGVSMTATPYVAAEGRTITLSINPKYVRFIGFDRDAGRRVPRPRFSVYELRTVATLPDGHSLMLGGAKPVVHVREAGADKEKAADADAVVLIWLTARVVRPPAAKGQ